MQRSKIYLLVLLFLTLPSILPYFNSQFFYTQDHIFIARLQQMSTALSDGYFPIRWAPDLRFGEPLFNFYAPLPFYLGALIKLLGFNFIWVAKILFILSSVLSAIAMFILCRRLFDTKSALLGAALYTYAPYRAVDLYVRGALSEAFAFVFFPLIFYASLLTSEKSSFKNILLLAFSLAGLMLTHNVTTLMFLPFLGLWWLHLILKKKNWKIIFFYILSFIIALTLSAFFLLPALLERSFIQTKYLTVGYFDFRAHFVAFYQFFSPEFGYGSSLWGPKDDISFQIGLTHWVVIILTILTGIFYRKNKKMFYFILFLFFSFSLSVILQHNKSAFIWEAIPLMAFIQFPWRFLAISVFIVSIMGALLADSFKNRFSYLYIILIFSVVFINLSFFKPREYVDDSFFDKFEKVETMRKGIDLTKDYLPIWVKTTDENYFGTPRAGEKEIEVLDFERRSNSARGTIKVLSPALIEFPITYFPGWEVSADGKAITQELPSDKGLIRIKLEKGVYNIKAEFKDTPVRVTGNYLTFCTISILLIVFGLKNYKLR